MYDVFDMGDIAGDSSLTFTEAWERRDDSCRSTRSVACGIRLFMKANTCISTAF